MVLAAFRELRRHDEAVVIHYDPQKRRSARSSRLWRSNPRNQRRIDFLRSTTHDILLVVSKNTNELKTRALGRFELEVSTLGSPAEVGLQRAAETARTALGPGSPPKWRLPIAETGWLQTPVIRKKKIAYRWSDSHESDVLRTPFRCGGNSARCLCQATDAITCSRKNAVFAARS